MEYQLTITMFHVMKQKRKNNLKFGVEITM